MINSARKFGAAIVAVPVKPTIKKINPYTHKIKCTLDRNSLWEAQTPQVFKKEIILKAHKRIRNRNAFDDASLVEKLGKTVKVIRGSYKNIKITTPEDLNIARAIRKGI